METNMETKQLLRAVDAHRAMILEAEKWLWKHPQTGYYEWQASDYLAEKYEKMGYTLTRAGNIPGFTADFDTGRPGPRVAVFGEMDALMCPDHPDADPATHAVHACGHHAQSAGLLGLAAALKTVGIPADWRGSVRLCAVPAEELIQIGERGQMLREGKIRFLGGKLEFMARGLLDGCDMAIMLHTAAYRDIGNYPGGNGALVKSITYQGRAVHASTPYEGVNALYAAQLGLQAVNSLRETFRDEDHIRFHPIVTEGGIAVNAIPSLVKVESYVRGADMDAILRENKKVNRALAGAAAAMGARVRLRDISGYAPLVNDGDLQQVLREVAPLTLEGGDRLVEEGWDMACTDMGDISQVMPAYQGRCGGAAGTGHGNDYRVEDADRACVRAAKVQLLMLNALLGADAARADAIVRKNAGKYPSIPDYLAKIESINREWDGVEPESDGRSVIVFD